jgi:hypothetical protein
LERIGHRAVRAIGLSPKQEDTFGNHVLVNGILDQTWVCMDSQGIPPDPELCSLHKQMRVRRKLSQATVDGRFGSRYPARDLRKRSKLGVEAALADFRVDPFAQRTNVR